jgi:Flp pilus assembly protein TadD
VLELVVKKNRHPPSAAWRPDEAAAPYGRRALRGTLDAVVLKAMAKRAADRYVSPRELAAAVDQHENRKTVPRRRRRGTTARTLRAAMLFAFAGLLVPNGGATLANHPERNETPVRTSRSPGRITSGGTARQDAWDAYRRGLEFWRRRTEPAAAVSAYRQALQLDSGFALAYVALADAYAVQASPSPEAERAISQALRLQPGLGEAFASIGFIRLFHYWDWAGAEEALREATRRAPSYAQAHHWLGCYLMLMRRFDEARLELERAQALDPGTPAIRTDLGLLAHYAGDNERAVEYCREEVLRPEAAANSQACLASAYERLGRFQDAWRIDEWHLGPLLPRGSGDRESLLAASSLWLERNLPEAKLRFATGAVVNGNLGLRIARAFAHLGRREETLYWLLQAYHRRAFMMPYVNVEPLFQEYREEAEFQHLLTSMGLPTG